MRRIATEQIPKNRLVWLIPVLLLYWAVGFYPFQFQFPFNIYTNAAVRANAHTLDFPNAGIGHTTTVPDWQEAAIQAKSLRVRLDVQAHRKQQFGPARILSVSKDTLERNLTIGQQGTDLIVRLRRPDSSTNGTPAFTVNGVFSRPGWHQFDLLIRSNRLQLSVDGYQHIDEVLFYNPFAAWTDGYRLALGNEFSFDRPWLGRLREARVSVPGASVDYVLAPENLIVPQTYLVPRPELEFNRALPFFDNTMNRNKWQDWLVNFFGFMPFGLLLALITATHRPVLFAALLSISLSLSIEITQFFFAGRHPALDDLVLNTLGGLAGIWIGCRIRICQNPQPAFNAVDA